MADEPEILENYPLAEFTTYKVGGPAEKLIIPNDIGQLQRSLKIAKENPPLHIIGGGSNLIIADRGLPGTVVIMRDCCRQLEITDSGVVTAGSGLLLRELVEAVVERGFTGLEKLSGIPGTLGGALTMNAGAYGAEVSDHLLWVEVLELDGTVAELKKDEIIFAYRSAPGLQGKIIIRAIFKFVEKNPAEARKVADEIASLRESKHPLEYPSAGSVFKRIPEGPAPVFIEQAGLKGISIGGAQVSTKHANFIVNRGNARAIEILALARLVQRVVRERFNLELQMEQRPLGFTEEEMENPELFI